MFDLDFFKNLLGISDASPSNQSANPHTHTKSEIVNFEHLHTIDDVSNLQAALNSKAASSHTHTKSDILDLNFKTINGQSIEGSGDISIGGSSMVFSTSETDTGMFWIDGKKIYCKMFQSTANIQPGAWQIVTTIPDGAKMLPLSRCWLLRQDATRAGNYSVVNSYMELTQNGNGIDVYLINGLSTAYTNYIGVLVYYTK